MKTLILAFALLTSVSAFAARDIVSIDCTGRSRDGLGDVTLTAKSLWFSENGKEASLRDVTMTSKADGETVTGRAADLESDQKYNPRKYKDHVRFDMSKLTETKKFGRFEPQECSISVMVPNDIVSSNSSRAELPVVVNCDQSGGSMTLSCKVGTER